MFIIKLLIGILFVMNNFEVAINFTYFLVVVVYCSEYIK